MYLLLLLPVPVRNFVTRNETLLAITVPALAIWLGGAMIDITIKPVYVIAPGTAISLYFMYREIKVLRMSKVDFDPAHYADTMWRATAHTALMLLVLILSVPTMLGLTYDKDGVGLLFILVIGLFA